MSAKITSAEFSDRLVALCIGGPTGMPKRLRDYHILLASMTLWMRSDEVYPESEVNERLRQWREAVGQGLSLDAVTLRRELIDSGYMTRDQAGRSYSAGPGNPEFTFASEVAELNPAEIVASALPRRESRKRAIMQNG